MTAGTLPAPRTRREAPLPNSVRVSAVICTSAMVWDSLTLARGARGCDEERLDHGWPRGGAPPPGDGQSTGPGGFPARPPFGAPPPGPPFAALPPAPHLGLS